MWRLTAKRRENLVKIFLNVITVDLAGLVVPFALKGQEFRGSIFCAGIGVAAIAGLVIYLMEK